MGALFVQIIILLALLFMIYIIMKVSGFITGKEMTSKIELPFLKKLIKEKKGKKTVQVNDWSIIELDEVGYPTSHSAELNFRDGKFTIGREKNNDFVLDNMTVSGKHAVVLDTPKGLILKNVKSSINGVKHKGEQVEEICLVDEMVLQFGKVFCKFMLTDSQGGILFDDGLDDVEESNSNVKTVDEEDYIQRKL